jgi:hypothetical protein
MIEAAIDKAAKEKGALSARTVTANLKPKDQLANMPSVRAFSNFNGLS